MNDQRVAESFWKFGVNDPSLIAWVIVVAYFVTAALCWRARTGAIHAPDSTNGMLWSVLSFTMILLCINKQLDLHKWCMDFIRDLLARRNVSPWLPGVWLLCGMIAIAILLAVFVWLFRFKILRKASSELCWAYVTLVSLLGLQVLRFLPGPISGLLLLHVFTEDEGLLHIHSIELLELGSLAAISYLARASFFGSSAEPMGKKQADRNENGLANLS